MANEDNTTLFLVSMTITLTDNPAVVVRNKKPKEKKKKKTPLTNCVLFSCGLLHNIRCTTMKSGYTASVREVKCDRLPAVFIGKKRMF